MSFKSNKRKNHSSSSSSSSSDNSSDDPDYAVRLSEKRVFSSTKRNKRKQTRQSQRHKHIKQEEYIQKTRTLSNIQECRRHTIKTNENSIENIIRREKIEIRTTIYSWLIDSNVIEENEEIFCTGKQGKVKREGILCYCCNNMFNALAFTYHCGITTTNRPYDYIFVAKTQDTLLFCMKEAWNNSKECVRRRRFNDIKAKGNAVDLHDDACMICADGGNLMCCEDCNSTYHHFCMGMEVLPRGSWYCPYCVCQFCWGPAFGDDDLIECPQCEKKYHWGCYVRRELKAFDLNDKTCAPFCDIGCKKVYEKLENDLIGVKSEIDEGFCWTLLHQMDEDNRIYIEDAYQRTMCRTKLAVAHRLLEDSFEPIFDRHSKIKMIPSIVYSCGSNFKRIHFRGFYTAILEKGDEIIAAACLRIHGTKLAEMPFIATSTKHRRKGMCTRLLVAIESALCYLNVQKLIIPSTRERIDNWIDKFGFNHLDDSLKKEVMCFNTVMFHDSVRLQKTLMPHRSRMKSAVRKTEGFLFLKTL